MTEDIRVTFIIPKDCRDDNECSEEMQLAFVTCEQHSGGGLQAKWVHESEYKQFEGLSKRDVFVLAEFEGELYEKLHSTKCLLVGPRCLSCCLTEGTPIPSGPEPVFTVAMRSLVVTASGLSKQQKETIKKKVHWMGGIYSTVLTDDTTHLVSDTVLSDKYIKSVEKGIPVMSISWIEAVWETSLRLNVSGSSSDFLVHRLPPFTNLQVTTSGITKKEKQMIMKLVNEHGGTFSGAFQSETTDVVVLTKEGIGSEKYKAALEYGKAVVLPAWVKDSAAKGIALPMSMYRVVGASTSSPLPESRLPDMSLNFSRITNPRPPSNFVDETRSTDVSTMSGKVKLSQDTKKNDTSIDKEVLTAFENFDMSLIKKAGPIFDGFCIWVCGLEGVCRERAAACVSRCGGVRYDAAHARVTHAVAAAPAAARAARALPAVPVLSPLWLLRSIQEGRALDETQFLIDTKPGTPGKSSASKAKLEVASPMSKRNLALLRRAARDLPPPAPDTTPQDELVNHYLSQNLPEQMNEKSPEPAPAPNVTVQQDPPDVTEDMEDEPTEEIEQIFRGLKIEVQGLDEESIIEIGAEVAGAGGALVAAPAAATHALVPLDFHTADLLTATAEPVTVFWLKDCLSQQEIVPIQYYHRPVHVTWSTGPLTGVVASLSTYSGVERAFLDELAKLLGATTQLRFCRRNTASALASTHLICPTAAGDKYAGAVKWGVPAVRADWLLHCAREGRRVSERDYLVGDTKGIHKYAGAVKWGVPAVRADWLLHCAREGRRVSERDYLVGDTKGIHKYAGAVKWGVPAVRADWLLHCAREGRRVNERDYLVGDTKGIHKYAGAVKWGVPAVRADWLLHCAREGRRVSERDYLVGDTKGIHKYAGAVKWGVPAVRADWLLHCAREGRRVSERDYLVGDTKGIHKYAGAVKWGVPAVRADWLLHCAREGRRVSERDYLVGDTKGIHKYAGAVKWGVPAVRADWLLHCAREGRRVSERDYLVGDTKAPEPPIEEEIQEEPPPLVIDEQANERTDEQTNTITDKENEMLPPAVTAVPRRGSVPSREQTPKWKISHDGDNEMSPASRYIAMARQGLLGCDSQETPKRVHDLKEDARQGGECAVRTPPLDDALSTPNLAGLSPTTRRRLQAVRRGEMPSDPIRTPNDPFDKNPATPDSAFGCALRPGSGRMSPDARKRLWRVVRDLPHKQHEPVKDKHTPLSEIRNRFLAQFNGDAPTPPSDHTVAPRKLHLEEQAETPPSKIAKLSEDQSPGSFPSAPPAAAAREVPPGSVSPCVAAQLQRLTAALAGRLSEQRARRTRDSATYVPPPVPDSEPAPESQPNTVGWDDTTPAQQNMDTDQPSEQPSELIKRFMLSSNVDNRDEIITMITDLGGLVCEGAELDPEATHLLCAAPGRSEKMLGSIAAGRWVLHPIYVTKSHAQGSFLPEEDYEWGNPTASSLPPLTGAERTLARAAHRWRAARAGGARGPFAGVVALLHVPAPRRRLLQRLVAAGDGLAPDLQPPYTADDITVCFADIKRYPLSDRDSAWLISKQIPVCAPVLLSAYLTDEPPPRPIDHCLPQFRP